ncbi:MAG TPA: MFS transporter, partial [Dehalococcoidia bacterium]|nr:MFS transporter [Dehalococcoidia bacterium]
MQNTVSYHKQRWGILAVLSFYAFTVFVALHTLTPVLSLVIDDLHISHAQSGLLVAIFSLPSILFIIPISYFVSRIGLKRLGIISISLMLAGSLLMLMAKSFPGFLAGRVIIGIGA